MGGSEVMLTALVNASLLRLCAELVWVSGFVWSQRSSGRVFAVICQAEVIQDEERRRLWALRAVRPRTAVLSAAQLF